MSRDTGGWAYPIATGGEVTAEGASLKAMKPSGRMLASNAFNGSYQNMRPRVIRHELQPGVPKTVRALAKAFMKYRAAKLAADPSVDTFFNRGESATRFAYFDE